MNGPDIVNTFMMNITDKQAPNIGSLTLDSHTVIPEAMLMRMDPTFLYIVFVLMLVLQVLLAVHRMRKQKFVKSAKTQEGNDIMLDHV